MEEKKVDASPSLEENGAKQFLIELLCNISQPDEMESLIDDLLTPKEIIDIVDRYLIMDDIYRGKSQRDIANNRKMSLCKITRGSKMLKKKNGFMRNLLSARYDDHTHI